MVEFGRNEKCICGSGLKYKKCCIQHNENNYKNICLLVGNGFTIDFLRSMNINSIDPSKPLSNFCCNDIDYSKFIDYIPDIIDAFILAGLSYSSSDQPEVNNFINACSRNGGVDFFIVNPNKNNPNIRQLVKYIEDKGHNAIEKEFLPWY